MSEIKITVDLPQERIDQLNRIETMLAKLTAEARPERAYNSTQVCKMLNIVPEHFLIGERPVR